MTETDLAYLAGIIDGEGCISVSENPRNGRKYYRLILDVTNTNDILMQWLEDTFGGIVRTNYARAENRSNLHGWTVSGKQCQELLAMVLPYLIIKKAQAELALAMNISDYGGSCRWSYTEEEEMARGAIREAIMVENHKGGNKGSYARQNSTQKEVNCPLTVTP